MKKLHSLAFYALVTPILTFGAGSALAEKSTDRDGDLEQQNTQRDQRSTQSERNTQREQIAADRQKMGDQSRKYNRGYMGSAPANGMQASNLIGAEVKTTGGEEVGPVDDLIIDENGQLVAIVVGAGGFLGMGEKDVAISWDHVTRSGTSDEPQLRIDVTREDLMSAPEFNTAD